jgi:hypothetical protein
MMAAFAAAHLTAQARSQSAGIFFSQGVPCGGQHAEGADKDFSSDAAWARPPATGSIATASETIMAIMALTGFTGSDYRPESRQVKWRP